MKIKWILVSAAMGAGLVVSSSGHPVHHRVVPRPHAHVVQVEADQSEKEDEAKEGVPQRKPSVSPAHGAIQHRAFVGRYSR